MKMRDVLNFFTAEDFINSTNYESFNDEQKQKIMKYASLSAEQANTLLREYLEQCPRVHAPMKLENWPKKKTAPTGDE